MEAQKAMSPTISDKTLDTLFHFEFSFILYNMQVSKLKHMLI